MIIPVCRRLSEKSLHPSPAENNPPALSVDLHLPSLFLISSYMNLAYLSISGAKWDAVSKKGVEDARAPPLLLCDHPILCRLLIRPAVIPASRKNSPAKLTGELIDSVVNRNLMKQRCQQSLNVDILTDRIRYGHLSQLALDQGNVVRGKLAVEVDVAVSV